jgi:hypothetical protein
MAFENVFQGIDFQAPTRAAQTSQQQFLNILGDSITRSQQQAEFDKRMELEMAKAQNKPFDLQQQAQQDAYNILISRGVPKEQAAIETYQQFQRPVMDQAGNLIQPADIMGNLGLGRQAPAAPMGMPQESMQDMQPQEQLDIVLPNEVKDLPAGVMSIPSNPVLNQKILETTTLENIKKDIKGLERFNEGQLQAANFASRMVESDKIFDELEMADPKAAKARTGFLGGISEALSIMPLGDFGSGLADAVVRVGGTPEQQKYLNAADNWITANLRKESGAVIGAEEKATEYRKYFPIAGDSGAVIEQKAKLREKVTKGMKGQSAGAYQEIFANENKQEKRRLKYNPATGRLE